MKKQNRHFALQETVENLNEQADRGVNTTEKQLTANATIVFHIVKQDGMLTHKRIAEQSSLSMRSVQRAMK
jgi:hypothetical protein